MGQDTIFILGILVLFLLFTVIPQFIQRRKHQQEISSIVPGSWVITAGGIVGQVVSIDPRFTKLRVSAGSEMVFVTQALRSRTSVPQDLFDSESDQADQDEYASQAGPRSG